MRSPRQRAGVTLPALLVAALAVALWAGPASGAGLAGHNQLSGSRALLGAHTRSARLLQSLRLQAQHLTAALCAR